jgi:hypothetical protein
MAIYGHRQLGLFFFPMVETRVNGFIFRGKNYKWKDVERVETWQELWPPFSMVVAEYVQRGRITLKDGKRIKINGRAFEKRNESLNEGYLTAFDELIDLFENQSRYNNQLQATQKTRA